MEGFGAQVVSLPMPDGRPQDYHTAFLRENLDVAIDACSLQRTSCNLPLDLHLTSSTQITSTSWKLAFSGGISGVFQLPEVQSSAAVGVEHQPQQYWGEGAAPLSELDQALATSHQDGGIRFSWAELRVDESLDEGGRAAEQLGAGRAVLSREVAMARARMIEAVRKYGMAIVDGVPTEPDMGQRLADAVVGAVETTNFG